MALSLRTRAVTASRPVARAVRPAARPVVRVFSTPDAKAVEVAIKEAEDACNNPASAGACAAAWDNVEEISAAISHNKVKEAENNDPLEKFCETAPDADECRVYSD